MAVTIYSRYYHNQVVEVNGKLTLEQREIPSKESFSNTVEHVMIGGETLDQLAKKYYGREDLWWRIADANPAVFPTDWKAGDVLAIPPIREATRTPRR